MWIYSSPAMSLCGPCRVTTGEIAQLNERGSRHTSTWEPTDCACKFPESDKSDPRPTHPDRRAYTRPSFNPSLPKKTSGPSPSRSMTPGLNGSIKTSLCWIIFLSRFRPLGIFELTAMERFPLARKSGGIFASPTRSTRMTLAPQSCRT